MSSLLCFAAVFAAQAAPDAPITIAATGHPTVPIEIAGHAPFTFVLDTGAEQTVLYHHHAIEHALPLRGGDELVDIDFRSGRFSLRSPQEDPRKLLQPDAVAVKATRVAGSRLSFHVQVHGRTGTEVLSGARDTRLNWRFASAAGFSAVEGVLPDAGVIHRATNTPGQSKSIELRELIVAGHTVRGLQGQAVDLPVFEQLGVADRPALILGFDALRNARIVIDLSRDVVWFDRAPAAPLAPAA